MKAWIHAAGPVEALLGGLLAAAGHEVAFFACPRRGGRATRPAGDGSGRVPSGGKRPLRLVLPAGWLRVSVTLRSAPPRGADLQLGGSEAKAPAGRAGARVALLDGSGPWPASPDPRPGARRAGGLLADPGRVLALALMTVVQMEPGEVELASRRSCLLLEKSELPAVRSFVEGLRGHGPATRLEVVEVEDIAGYADSWFVSRLLLLPEALCRTTPEHFLSWPQGREIARHVLEEGLNVLRALGRKPQRLPCADPQELLEALGSREQDFEPSRFAPGREWGQTLQEALRGEGVSLRGPNETLVRLASQAGSEAPWNWRLTRKRGRLQQGAFYSGPAGLREAIG